MEVGGGVGDAESLQSHLARFLSSAETEREGRQDAARVETLLLECQEFCFSAFPFSRNMFS